MRQERTCRTTSSIGLPTSTRWPQLTPFLRLTLRTTLELGVDPASLVHALQNHDELTYELVHWSTGHRDDVFTFKGEELTGEALGDSVRQDLLNHLTGENAPYNQVFTTNGIACTTATVIAATLGITDLDTIDDVDRIRGRICYSPCSMPFNPAFSRFPGGICAAC